MGVIAYYKLLTWYELCNRKIIYEISVLSSEIVDPGSTMDPIGIITERLSDSKSHLQLINADITDISYQLRVYCI